MKRIASVFFSICLLFFVVLLNCSCGGSKSANSGGDVYILNFGDYMAEEALQIFESETGIRVHQDVFEANEEVLPVIEGGAKYDVICISDYMIEKMREKGLLETLNKSKIPNFVNINKKQLEYLSVCDPGNDCAVPYFCGGMGIMYNKTLLDKMGIAYPTKWADLWNEKFNKELIMQSSIRDLYTVGLMKNGFSPNSTNKFEIEKATEDFIKQKPYVQAYLCDQIKDKLLLGEAAIAPITSGDVQYVFLEGGQDKYDYGFIIPEEGTCLFIDAWCVLKNADNKENAYKFIDYMCREDIARINAEYVGYETVNDKAPDEEFLYMRKIPGVYNDYSHDNNVLERDVGDAMRFYTDGYNRLKAG